MDQNLSLSAEQERFIREAVRFLERPSVLVRIANTLGAPLALAQSALPAKSKKLVQTAVSRALGKALEVAVSTIPNQEVSQLQNAEGEEWDRWQSKVRSDAHFHTAITGVTGAVGGFFGLLSLPLELPLTTTIMLRSISDIAAKNGIDMSRPENRLECLYVFTLGSKSKLDDDLDSAYLSSRLGFAQSIRTASAYVATHSVKEVLNAVHKGTAPAMVQFIGRVATLFESAVSQKILAKAVPVVGALGGAAVNAAFTDYFNEAARYHFGLKRLETLMGQESVHRVYREALANLSQDEKAEV